MIRDFSEFDRSLLYIDPNQMHDIKTYNQVVHGNESITFRKSCM